MNAFGGRLQVRDLPGKGCMFTIDLPKQPPEAWSNGVQSDPSAAS